MISRLRAPDQKQQTDHVGTLLARVRVERAVQRIDLCLRRHDHFACVLFVVGENLFLAAGGIRGRFRQPADAESDREAEQTGQEGANAIRPYRLFGQLVHERPHVGGLDFADFLFAELERVDFFQHAARRLQRGGPQLALPIFLEPAVGEKRDVRIGGWIGRKALGFPLRFARGLIRRQLRRRRRFALGLQVERIDALRDLDGQALRFDRRGLEREGVARANGVPALATVADVIERPASARPPP